MYSVYADDVCIYNDAFMLEDAILISPVLTLEKNAAGSFEFTIPCTNKAYSTASRLSTYIYVKRNGEEIWCGRIISEEKDFWNNRKVVCEGELAILNDTTQPMAEYHDITPADFLRVLIANHNAKVSEDKQFRVGVVTVTDANNSLYRYTNYEKTIECINEKLVERLGGYLRIRKENGVRYLDYLAEQPITNTQTINFGKNLMDFVGSWDEAEYATVILPFGAQLDTSPISALEAYLTVESVNHGSKYVQNAEAVSQFGWIEKVVHWDDVTTASSLLSKAQAYLSELQFDNMTIEVNALDLHYLDADVQAINLLDRIRVISEPHGLDKIFPVSKLEIPLDSPEETVFTLGTNIQTSLTSVNNNTSAAILSKIASMPSEQSVLEKAKQEASAVMNLKTTGFITIVQNPQGTGTDAMYISELADYTASDKYWRFNMNGLGYTKDGGQNWDIAITMDGKIVADFITTGTMSADRVRTGILRSTNGNVIFNLDTGTLTMKAGSININNKFMVDTNGNLTAKNATVDGTFFAGSKDNNKYWIELTSGGKLAGGKGSDTYGYIDYSARIHHLATDTYSYGIKMAADWLYLSHDGISVREHNDDTETATSGGTGTINYISRLENTEGGGLSWTTSTLRFIHGIMVTDISS